MDKVKTSPKRKRSSQNTKSKAFKIEDLTPIKLKKELSYRNTILTLSLKILSLFVKP